jgi:hypothetical protein
MKNVDDNFKNELTETTAIYVDRNSCKVIIEMQMNLECLIIKVII